MADRMTLQEQALTLAEEDRAAMASALLHSLEPPRYSVSDEEVLERRRQLESGEVEEIRRFPTRHHLDASGLRRKNLKRFPFHILYEILSDLIRVMVIRHDRRNPEFGLRRQ